MTTDAFFHGLFATLARLGWKFIDAREGDHHRRFDRVVELINQNSDFADSLPITLIPSPITGTYRELDDALIRFQFGVLSAQNPFYPGMNVDESPALAERVLKDYSDEERQFLNTLGTAFINVEPQAAH